MISEIAWDAFKKTGDINFYLELKEMEKLKQNIKECSNETDKSKWSDFS